MQAKLIKDSIANEIRLSTFILEYPRIIHSEFLKHRVLSNNAASSRAIPTKAIIQNIRDNPADIVWWGKNMSGMQAKEELTGWQLQLAKLFHVLGRESSILEARLKNWIGLHKQIANRCLEPYQNIRTVTTGTEWNNFFNLRDHSDAQPEFAQLARMMKLALEASKPTVLHPGEWHIPYITSVRMPGRIAYLQPEIAQTECVEITLEQALKISASMAAQESYRKSDPSLAKAEAIWERLMCGDVKHSSPTEHQAKAMQHPRPTGFTKVDGKFLPVFDSSLWEDGVTHVSKDGRYWSGNFSGWIQHRQLIPNHDVKG